MTKRAGILVVTESWRLVRANNERIPMACHFRAGVQKANASRASREAALRRWAC